jgi:hypothetical protein
MGLEPKWARPATIIGLEASLTQLEITTRESNLMPDEKDQLLGYIAGLRDRVRKLPEK